MRGLGPASAEVEHNLPLMPVPINTTASSVFCCPMVSGLAFSMGRGVLSEAVDVFADPFWVSVRDHIAHKAVEMRRQGFFGPAMLGMSEVDSARVFPPLEYDRGHIAQPG